MIKYCICTTNYPKVTISDRILNINQNYFMIDHRHPTWIHYKLKIHWNLFTFSLRYLKLTSNNMMLDHRQFIMINHKLIAQDHIPTTKWNHLMLKNCFLTIFKNLFTFVSCHLKLSSSNLMLDHHQFIIVNRKLIA